LYLPIFEKQHPWTDRTETEKGLDDVNLILEQLWQAHSRQLNKIDDYTNEKLIAGIIEQERWEVALCCNFWL
jgi:outer membrane biogenesis lipoprotein LolB